MIKGMHLIFKRFGVKPKNTKKLQLLDIHWILDNINFVSAATKSLKNNHFQSVSILRISRLMVLDIPCGFLSLNIV